MHQTHHFPTLEEIASSSTNISSEEFSDQYGKKTYGLVTLIRFKKKRKTRLEQENIDFYVPPGFVVAKSQTIHSDVEKALLMEKYIALGNATSAQAEYDGNFEMSGERRNKCMMLIRETDKDEKPGDLETKVLVFDPQHPKKSFEQFYFHLARMKSQGHTLIVQGGVGYCENVDLLETDVYVTKVPLSLDNVDLHKLLKELLGHGMSRFEIGIHHINHMTLATFTLNLAEAISSAGSGYTLEEVENDREKLKSSVPLFREYLKQALAKALPDAENDYNLFWETMRTDNLLKDRVISLFSEIQGELELQVNYKIHKAEDRPIIGAHCVSMVARSHDHFQYGKGSVDVCGGLATKLVRDDSGKFVTIFFSRQRSKGRSRVALDFSPTYRRSADSAYFREFKQGEMDVFDLEKGRVIRINSEEILCNEFYNGCWPIPDGAPKNAEKIAWLACELSAQLGMCVELEASSEMFGLQFNPQNKMPRYESDRNIFDTGYNRLGIFQLTMSPIPVDVIDDVTPVEKERLLIKTDYFFGSIFHSGAVVIYTGRNFEIPKKILNDYIQRGEMPLYVDWGNTGYPVAFELGLENMLEFNAREMLGKSNNHANAMLAETVASVYEKHKARLCIVRQEFYINQILSHALSKDHIKYYDENIGLLVLGNMGVEAAKGTFQMYFK